jgi:hypothetical protein
VNLMRSPCIPEEWRARLAPLCDKDRSPFPPFSILRLLCRKHACIARDADI